MQKNITKPISFSTKFLNNINNFNLYLLIFHKQQINILTHISNIIQLTLKKIITSIQFPFSNN